MRLHDAHKIANRIAAIFFCFALSGCFSGGEQFDAEVLTGKLRWVDRPSDCSGFWNRYFAEALAGEGVSANALYSDVATGSLVPPGRDVNAYPAELREFDLRALMLLSIRPYVSPDGDRPYGSAFIGVSDPTITGVPRSDPLSLFKPGSTMHHIERLVQDKYLGALFFEGRVPLPPIGGICADRSGYSHFSKEWAVACRQILINDGILPSVEEFLKTIPQDLHACGFKGN